VAERPIEGRVSLTGLAGTGKTTAGVARLSCLLERGVPGRQILVIVPQRTLGLPYQEALAGGEGRAHSPGSQVTIQTLGGVAQRMVELFWPLVAEQAGFGHPDAAPRFLTLETAQYYMARLVRPLLDEGLFESVVIDRNRLYSQIIDNLNKAAVVGFTVSEIGQRLKAAAPGDTPAQRRIYDEAQLCADRFRAHCLAHNLLDFSLQFETFTRFIWPLPLGRTYLQSTYRHLIADNVEEDTPVAHDILAEWLQACDSALVIHDDDAGFRRFLGADPDDALRLRDHCDTTLEFEHSYVMSPDLAALGAELARSMGHGPGGQPQAVRRVLVFDTHRYHPQMVDWVAERIAELVHDEGVAPGQIAVLAPFLTDSLRFALVSRLDAHGVPTRSHRPSRALRDEPATRSLLTLTAIAHPFWSICPSRFDVAYALMQAIDGLDLVRAQLLAQIVYRVRDGCPVLTRFERIEASVQERLTFALGERYDRLLAWLEGYTASVRHADPEKDDPSNTRVDAPLDHFLSRLFGEVLSQPGFGFHSDYDAAAVAANLIESIQKFRWVAAEDPGDKPLGQEYVEMVRDGIVAAQYIQSWRLQPEDAVLLAPAYTFLMNNRQVDYQFWLDVGGSGWWERLYQPLTHPYVLSRRWPHEAVWTDGDEHATRHEALHRLTQGLIRRCRRGVYLGLSELSEQGADQKGALLIALQRVLRRIPHREPDGEEVGGAPGSS